MEQDLNERLDSRTSVVVDALLTHAAETRGASLNLTRRVADRAAEIAHRMGMSEEEIQVIRKAAVLRDVGKAGIPDNILRKSGPLTAREYDEVRARMLPEGDAQDSDRVRAAILVAHHHHERVDGHGYPGQLKGEEIPLGSRILAVAEAYETMMVPAPWRPARTPEDALNEARAATNTQFDQQVVDALATIVNPAPPGPSAPPGPANPQQDPEGSTSQP